MTSITCQSSWLGDWLEHSPSPAALAMPAFPRNDGRRERKEGAMRIKGKITHWNPDKAFGFITLAAGVFLLFVLLAAAGGLLPPAVPVFYIGLSLFAYLVYALDKSAARAGAWRTAENRLHILALLGGWPGALIAQQVLRHKSRKASFRLTFWVTVVLNCAALAWLFTPGGAAFVQGLAS